MKKSHIVCLILMSFLIVPVFALDVTIEYLDGYLDIRDDGEWYELSIGESVSETDTIRLDTDSVAELRTTGTKLTLTKPGIYVVSDLLQASGQSRSLGIASVIGNKIKTLVEEPKQAQTAVMGVRGAKSEDELEWMSGDTAELLKAGKDYMAENELVDAVEVLEEAYDFADETEEDEVLFYLGLANALMGELRLALEAVDFVEPDPSMEFYADLILLKGQLLTESFAYNEAIGWLANYNQALANDASAAQMSYLLQGISHQGLGNSSNARKALEKAVGLDDSSDAGRAAQGVLRDL